MEIRILGQLRSQISAHKALELRQMPVCSNSSVIRDVVDPVKHSIARSSNMRNQLQTHFESYLNETNFLSLSLQGWMKYASRLRNTLRNDQVRFQLAHIQVSQ